MDASTTQCPGRIANTKRDMLEAFDSRNNKLYLCGRGDPPSCSTEIYVVDVKTRVVTNLSDQLRHLKPDFSLCARENTQASFKPLPSLSLGPSFTFMTLNSSNYLILFGGEEFGSSDNRPVSELIFIDVDNLRWWREPITGPRLMRRRSGAVMTAFNGKIFIFGGHDPANRRANGPVVNSFPSYSVLEFNNERGQWIVIQTDVPYPQDVIGKLTFKYALPVYNDKQIFLTPFIDRTVNPTGTELTPDNICFFDPNSFTFQLMRLPSNTPFPMASINVTGDRDRGTPEFEALALKPEPERCYDWLRQTFIDKADGEVIQTDIWNLYKDTFSSSNVSPLLGPADVIKSVKNVFPGSMAHSPIPLDAYSRYFMIKGIERRKLALNYTYHPYREPKPESVTTGQSILIAGWKCGENGRRGIYELWKLSLFPDNKIVCLDMSDKLQRANFGVRHAVVVDGRVYLLSSVDTFEITEDEKIRRVKGFELSIDS